MATNFPTSLDNGTSLPYPSSNNLTNSPSLASSQDNQNDSLIAIQNKLGITASTPTASNLLIGTGAGTSTWSKLAPTGAIVGTTDTQNLYYKTLLSAIITSPIITNATLTTDFISGFTTSNSGSIYGIGVSTGNVTMPGTLNVAGATTFTGSLSSIGQPSFQTTLTPPVSGVSTAGIKLSSTTNLGIFFGNGVPTFTAAQGAIYLNTTGSSTSTRLYVNTSGSTIWTNFVSAI